MCMYALCNINTTTVNEYECMYETQVCIVINGIIVYF